MSDPTERGAAPKLNQLSEERDYSRALDAAAQTETPSAFRKAMVDWWRFFPDAKVQARKMDPAALVMFREGLFNERKGKFAGEEWAERFGAILLPKRAMEASQVAQHYHVPWGAAVLRLAELETRKPHV